MSPRDHGAVFEPRAIGRAEGRAEEETKASETMTFGPGFALYVVPVLALLAGAWLLYVFLVTPSDEPAGWLAVAVLLWITGILAVVVGPIAAWARYRLDAAGLERRTLDGRRQWTWAEIGGVRGRELDSSGRNSRRWRDGRSSIVRG